jgi:hypothetical protein
MLWCESGKKKILKVNIENTVGKKFVGEGYGVLERVKWWWERIRTKIIGTATKIRGKLSMIRINIFNVMYNSQCHEGSSSSHTGSTI